MNSSPIIGDIINVQAYKHDGTLYRQWNGLKVVESSTDLIILLSLKTKVAKACGQNWIIRNPMLWFFSTKDFYNTNIMIKKEGPFFYTNLASPAIFEEKTIKYIDYDLDVKMYPNKKTQVVDEHEYFVHKQKYNYSQKLINKIDSTLKEILKKVEKKDGIFNYEIIKKYMKIIKKQKLIKKNINLKHK